MRREGRQVVYIGAVLGVGTLKAIWTCDCGHRDRESAYICAVNKSDAMRRAEHNKKWMEGAGMLVTDEATKDLPTLPKAPYV